MIAWLEANGRGRATTTYRLRDWLFSRQRYWGEPFPIVYDETGLPIGLPESMLPVGHPLDDFRPPRADPDDGASEPEQPLSRVDWWANVELDLGDGPKRYRRELNVMPQWAGSCWYELRYLDPTNENRFVDPDVEEYWMGPTAAGDPAAWTSTSAASSTPCCTCCTPGSGTRSSSTWATSPPASPTAGCSTRATSWPPRSRTSGRSTSTPRRSPRPTTAPSAYQGRAVAREWGKMGKSLKNAVGPDDIYAEYGADTLRLYEMSMGPFDTSRPWSTRDIVGYYRFLQRLWRNLVDEQTGAIRVTDAAADDETRAGCSTAPSTPSRPTTTGCGSTPPWPS